MPIILPDIESANMHFIKDLPVIFQDRKPKAGRRAEVGKGFVAPYKNANGSGYVRLILGGHANNHVHIDIATKEFFRDEQKPQSTGSIKRFFEILDRFMGHEVDVGLIGIFEIDPVDLPPNGIIRSMIVEQKTGDVGIKMSGARLSVTGAPIRQISWSERPNKKFYVTLTAQIAKVKLSDDYLVEALKKLQKALNVFVYGRTSNEPMPANT